MDNKKQRQSKSAVLSAYYSEKNFLKNNFPTYSQEEPFKLSEGREVGIIGRGLYGGGIDLSKGGTVKGDTLITATKTALMSNDQIFYEAAFISRDGNYYFQSDILVKSNKKMRIIEVKSSMSVKTPEHIYDIAFQWRILAENEYDENSDIYLAYLNSNYIRDADLDIDQLFVMEKVTTRAKNAQRLIEQKFNLPHNEKKKKKSNIIQQVSTEWWKALPENNIYNSISLKKSQAEFFQGQGIIEPEQIPRDSNLRDENWIEIDSAIQNKLSVNPKAIKKFLSTLEPIRPISFVAFGAVTRAIPQFTGTRPYQPLLFQYCLLFQEKQNQQWERREFLLESSGDPRKKFIKHFLEDTEDIGNIVIYNAEQRVEQLMQLSNLFPEYKLAIEERISRFKDLMFPFEKKQYYHPSFKGKYYLEVILPVLFPELYKKPDGLKNRFSTIYKYHKFNSLSLIEQIKTKRQLEEQCYSEVLGLVRIVQSLSDIIKK